MSDLQPISVPTAPSPGISARRIRFVAQLPPGSKARQEFRLPRVCFALEENVDLKSLPLDRPWPEPADSLIVLHLPANAAVEWQRFGAAWLMPANHPEAVQPITIQGNGRTVLWRPGRALIQGDRPQKGKGKSPQPAGVPEDVLAALVDFAFHEAELRNLELAVKIGESSIPEDIPRAYKIRYRERRFWPHFREMIEYFARCRLTYAQLEPRLVRGSRTLPLISQRWVERLLELAHVEERLEEVNDRLETGEYLYEGANDRVSDYKGYHFGHLLEIIIIVFLVVEVVVMSVETYVQHSILEVERQREMERQNEE